jgi:hypothetical protein
MGDRKNVVKGAAIEGLRRALPQLELRRRLGVHSPEESRARRSGRSAACIAPLAWRRPIDADALLAIDAGLENSSN